MEASPTHEDGSLHAELDKVNRESFEFSPAGLADEVAGVIDGQYPEFEGVLGHITTGMLCYEGEQPRLIDVLNGFVQQRAWAEAEAADRQVAEEARALPDEALARLVHDATRKK